MDRAEVVVSRERIIGLIQVGLAASSWGTWSLFLRPSGVPYQLSSPILLVVMAVVSLALARSETVTPKWDRTAWGLLVAHGITDAVNVLTFFGAMAKTTVALAVLSHYLAPLIVSVASPFLGEPRNARAIPSALLGLFGLTIVLEPWNASSWPAGTMIGVLLGATSALAYASNIFLASRLSARIGPGRSQGYHSALSALLLLPFAFGADTSHITLGGLLWMLIGAAGPGALSGVIFVRGLRVIGSTTTSMLTYLEPIVAVLTGVLFWHEPLSHTAWIGVALVLAAGVLVVTDQKPTSSATDPGSVR